jgi:hypothetical protein
VHDLNRNVHFGCLVTIDYIRDGHARAVCIVGTPRQALDAHVLLRQILRAAVDQILRPWLHLTGLEIRRDVFRIFRLDPLPQA